MSKSLTWSAGTFSADTVGYNGSADKVITVPTAISHLATRGKLTITHNGLSDTYDPASDKPMTLPHSALTVNFGSATAQTTSVSYDTSTGRTITIPTSTAHLTKSGLKVQYGSNVANRTSAVTYDTTSAITVDVPTSLSGLTNGVVADTNTASTTSGCISFTKPLCVTGTITASGAIYSSDRNLKENIKSIDAEDISKVGAIDLKSFNFIDDESKTKIYGVIAQEVQEAGLDILVHQKEDGMLGVDYTSFLILKVAQLQRDNNNLVNFVASLDKRVKELEEKLEKKD
jgi:hypothetical protein